jgi:acetyltransferase-like isoleucine patch superfamily enzyme
VIAEPQSTGEAIPPKGTLRQRALDRYLPYSSFYNPWRRTQKSQPVLVRALLWPVVRIGLLAGFRNIDYALVNGPRARLEVGPGCSTVNTVFNVVSGRIVIGADTLFSNDCQVLTGIHRFHRGRRASLLTPPPFGEVPRTGRDITIGEGCFFGAGATVIGPCTIGDNVIVGAGAVVASDLPSGTFAGGIPARVIRRHADDEGQS